MSGTRRGEPAPRHLPSGAARTAGLSGLIAVICLIGWVGAITVAIRFGRDVKDGSTSAVIALSIFALIAVAALFAALVMAGRALRGIGLLPPPPEKRARVKGGRRAAR